MNVKDDQKRGFSPSAAGIGLSCGFLSGCMIVLRKVGARRQPVASNPEGKIGSVVLWFRLGH